jgi:hypothetical protein
MRVAAKGKLPCARPRNAHKVSPYLHGGPLKRQVAEIVDDREFQTQEYTECGAPSEWMVAARSESHEKNLPDDSQDQAIFARLFSPPKFARLSGFSPFRAVVLLPWRVKAGTLLGWEPASPELSQIHPSRQYPSLR